MKHFEEEPAPVWPPERSLKLPKTVTEERARQGRRGKNVLVILVAGLALALAVWAGVEIYGQMIEPPGEDLPVTAPAN
jgi:hypothetical protein